MTAGAESSSPGFQDTNPWSPLSATHDYRHCRLLLYSPTVTLDPFWCLHMARKENLCQTGTKHKHDGGTLHSGSQQHTQTLGPLKFTFMQATVSYFLEITSISRETLLPQGQASQGTLSCLVIPLGRLQAVPAHNRLPKEQLQRLS